MQHKSRLNIQGRKMSLYNNLFGFSPEAGLLLTILNIDMNTIPRFRDCYFDVEKNAIVIHTRTGGGNREDYVKENQSLAQHDCYKYDCDDDFDSTYANFYFSIPEGFEGLKEAFNGRKNLTPGEKWALLLAGEK